MVVKYVILVKVLWCDRSLKATTGARNTDINDMRHTCSTRAVNIPIPISDVINVDPGPKNVVKHKIKTSMNIVLSWQIGSKILSSMWQYIFSRIYIYMFRHIY